MLSQNDKSYLTTENRYSTLPSIERDLTPRNTSISRLESPSLNGLSKTFSELGRWTKNEYSILWPIYEIRIEGHDQTIRPWVKIYKGSYFKGATKTERAKRFSQDVKRRSIIQRYARGQVQDPERANRVSYCKYYDSAKKWK